MAKDDLGIVFGAEPPTANRESRYARLYEALESNPNTWADVTDAIASIASKTEKGKIPLPSASAVTLRNNGFEATTRVVDGTPRVFAKFVPEGTESEQA